MIKTFKHKSVLTFVAITLFYFFEAMQFSYFNVLAPSFIQQHLYTHQQVATLSAAYLYGVVLGLVLVGLLSRFALRKTLLAALFGSVVGAVLLVICQHYALQFIARFTCGFFGGAFSFVGGIRVISLLFPKRFTLCMGLFLSAGTLGGLICQYPLLVVIRYFGVSGALIAVAAVGVLVFMFNILCLHPENRDNSVETQLSPKRYFWQNVGVIIKNRRNWLDCLMIILLDTPVSLLGTLWGITILMQVFHLSSVLSAWVISGFFIGMLIAYPVWGALSDKYHHTKWIIIVGALLSFLILLPMLLSNHLSWITLLILFFALGVFSSCQTLGFTWLTNNMRADLIGQNSAFNSMVFMGANGGLKQFSAYLLVLLPMRGYAVLGFVAICIFVAFLYVLFRGSGLSIAEEELTLEF